MERHKIICSDSFDELDESMCCVTKGAGFCFQLYGGLLANVTLPGTKILNFVKKHDDKMYNKIGTEMNFDLYYNTTYYEVDDIMTAFDNCGEHFHEFLARIISKETGIPVTADEVNDEYYILLEENYPWMMARNMKSLTPEMLREILQRYVSEISDVSIELFYYEIYHVG